MKEWIQVLSRSEDGLSADIRQCNGEEETWEFEHPLYLPVDPSRWICFDHDTLTWERGIPTQRPAPSPSPTAGSPTVAYAFVQVGLANDTLPCRQVADTPEPPIWHHGANAGQKQLYSGELLCELTTLSPLLVGNLQVPWQEAGQAAVAQDLEKAIRAVTDQALQEAVRAQVEQEQNEARRKGKEFDENRASEEATEKLKESLSGKKVIFPLQAPGGDVLIPGESLKGMFRQSLGALLSAPIERIHEETFSYRPNAMKPDVGGKTKAIAAQILHFDAQKLLLQIRPIPNIRQVRFVRGPLDLSGKRWGEVLPVNTALPGKRQDFNENQRRLSYKEKRRDELGRPDATLDVQCVWLRYQYGVDANRKRLIAHSGSRKYTERQSVLVPTTAFDMTKLCVDPAVVRQYLDTQIHLNCKEHGHRSRLPSKEAEDSLVAPQLAEHDLVFCEVDTTTTPNQVISFGHNFRYRWKHVDSVCTVAVAFDGEKWITLRRAEVTAHPEERPDADGRPAKLTSVRGMLGFVIEPQSKETDQEAYGALRELRDPFNRLAGRISFNVAMERVATDEQPAQRFVNADKHCLLFMHPLGLPKRSYWPGYVPGDFRTWGDGIRLWADKKAGTVSYQVQNGTCVFHAIADSRFSRSRTAFQMRPDSVSG